MKTVVIGASGRIGRRLVCTLRRRDVSVLEASPSHGVNTITGEGLDQALHDAAVVVDVSNSPTLDGAAPLRFFEASGRRLLAAGKAAGVQHHIALSIVGTDGLQASGYFRGKKVQEDLIKDSEIPYSILRSTQFFDFIAGVVQNGEDNVVISPALAQPVAAMDVAEALADLATGEPLNRTVEVAGPERFRLSEVATEVLTAYEDPRRIIPDPQALYFGAELTDQSLLPGRDARIGALRFEDWLRQTSAAARYLIGGHMEKDRLIAFSDGVLAIVITIMVLELKSPREPSLAALAADAPTFFAYVLSFIYIGIYWNNHHHLFALVSEVRGAVLWANLHLLFWLSLIPFATSWLGEHPASEAPAAIYGLSLLMPAIAYYLLQTMLVRGDARDSSELARALGRDLKGRLSPILYVVGIVLSFFAPYVAEGTYALVALMWLIPDSRIERAVRASRSNN